MFVNIMHISEDKINDKFLEANQNIITSVDELIRPMKTISEPLLKCNIEN